MALTNLARVHILHTICINLLRGNIGTDNRSLRGDIATAASALFQRVYDHNDIPIICDHLEELIKEVEKEN